MLLIGWLVLPFYFITSGVYLNWPAVHEWHEVARLFVGVNAVGTWDELFFIMTVFVLYKRHFPAWQVNLLQGWVYSSTRSLVYVLAVHLLFDAVVFLVIVHARNGGVIPFFLISP